MKAVIYSDDAKRDLQNIWHYTVVTWSRAQANKYYQSILAACNKLALNPALGRRFEEVSERYLGYREGRHVIFIYGR